MRWVFDGFEIDEDGARLLRDGKEVPIERRSLDLLCYLARNPGRLIRKAELLERVWDAHALGEGVLSNAVAKLRKALGQEGRAREPIETVHGRGYRFHSIGQRHAASESQAAALPPLVDPFVGRRGVLELLAESVERAARSGGVLVITGEAGIGKSRTLAELSQLAQARGFTTWVGAGYAGSAAPAYWPWVEIVRAALADDVVRKLLPRDVAALPKLVPELLTVVHPVADDAHALRFRLFDELTRWLAAAAALAPRLIVIEDLHWADSASVELLAHLARGLEHKAVLLAVSVRDYELGRDDNRAVVLQRLARSAGHVALQGLSLQEVSELVQALAGSTPDARTIGALHELTQGNPFFVRQVVQLLGQRGQPIETASFESTELPAAIRGVIAQRLDALPVETRNLLRAAAVIGPTFEASTIARLLELDQAHVLQVLEPTLHSGILRSQASPLLRFEFGHTLLQDALYEELPLAERGALHARMVDVIGEPSAADAQRLGEIARHSLLAVPFTLEACVRHCRSAAAAARDASGFETATEFLSLALEKLAADSGFGVQRCEVLFELGLDEFCAGDIAAGARALADGARCAREIGAWKWFARFVCRLTSWSEVAGNDANLASLVEDALAGLPETELALRAALLARRAEWAGDLDGPARTALWVEAQRLAELAAAPEALLDIAISKVGRRNPAALADSRDAVSAYRALERRFPHVLLGPQQLLRGFSVEMTDYWSALITGDLARADLALLQCDAAAAAARVPQMLYMVHLMRAGRALGDGRLDDAAACVERMQQHSDHGGGLGMAAMFGTLLLAEAREDRTVVDVMTRAGDLSVLDWLSPRQRLGTFAWLTAVFARHDYPEAARTFLERISQADIDRMPMRYGDIGILCSLAESCCALEDAVSAARLYTLLLPYATCNAVGHVLQYRGSVAHYLGMLALALGRVPQAVEHLQAAVAFNTKLGMQLQGPQSRALLARAAART